MDLFVVSKPACACVHADRDRCRFCVAWQINPHMRVGAADPAIACEQLAAFSNALRVAGARVLHVPFLHGAFDSVFMKDSAILIERDGRVLALPATFRHSERTSEPHMRARQLRRAGFVVADALPDCLEGGDIALIPHRDVALLGHGVRSHRDASAGLARFLGCDVIALELRDPSLFHLDTALTVLGDDTLVFCSAAFTPAAVRMLARMRFRRVVDVDRETATSFGVNVVEVGDAIVTGTPGTALWPQLGRRVIESPLDQFHLAGGSAACLTARVTSVATAVARAA
jgi:N-dimethylarginine dimethylaminohydrolase